MQKKISLLYCFVSEYNYLELSSLNKNIHIIYRNYKKNIDISTLISLKKYCKKNNKKLFISNNIKLALRHKLDGIYIPAFNNQLNYVKFTLPKSFIIIGSAHNVNEITTKQTQGCKFIFISPIFEVKKTNHYLDIIKFNLLALQKKSKFIALGGINSKNIKRLNLLKISGFAGISFFKKKTAPKRGRLCN